MGAPASQTVTQDVDPAFRDRLMSLYGDAQNYLGSTQYQPYGGPLVAGLDPMEASAQNYLSQGILGTPYSYQAPQRYGPFQGVPFGATATPYDPSLYRPTYDRDPGGEPPIDDSSDGDLPGDEGSDPDVDGPLRMAALQAGGGYITHPTAPMVPSPVDGPAIQPPAPPAGPNLAAPPGTFDHAAPTPIPAGPVPMGQSVGSAQNQFASGVAQGLTGYNPMMVTPGMAQGYGDVGAQQVAPGMASGYGDVSAGSVTPGTAAGYGDVGAQSIAAQTGAGGMSAYQNPYQQQVIDGALADMGRAEAMFREGGIYSAGTGTYGGDRQAVQVAEANRDFADRAGRLSAQLRSQGFDTAAGLAQQDANRGLSAAQSNQAAGLQAGLANQGAFNALSQFNTGLGMQGQLANQSAGLQAALANQGAFNDLSRFNTDVGLRGQLANQGAGLQAALANQGQFNDMSQFNAGLGMQGQLANQQAGLAGAGLNLNAANALNSFGNDAFRNMLTGAGALSSMGQGNRALSQQMINADIGQFDEARNAGLRDIGVLQSILSGMPVGMSSTTTMQPNTASQIGGGLLGLLGGGLSGGLFNNIF